MLTELPFEISFGGFPNFLLGMAAGFVFSVIFLIVFVIRGKRENLEKSRLPQQDFDSEQVKEIIRKKQELVKNQIEEKNGKIYNIVTDASYDLINEISRYCFPKSKYPSMELTVDEFLDLSRYISNRIDEMTDKPFIKYGKKVKVVRIVKMYEMQKSISESKFLEKVKQYKVVELATVGVKTVMRSRKLKKAALIGSKAAKKSTLGNAVTVAQSVGTLIPPGTFQKMVVEPSKNMVYKKVLSAMIGIVGEEATKVYTKKAFNESIDIDMINKDVDIAIEKRLS